MTDIDRLVERLEALCHPSAEALSDCGRINAFITVGDQAAAALKEQQATIATLVAERDQLQAIIDHHLNRRGKSVAPYIAEISTLTARVKELEDQVERNQRAATHHDHHRIKRIQESP